MDEVEEAIAKVPELLMLVLMKHWSGPGGPTKEFWIVRPFLSSSSCRFGS